MSSLQNFSVIIVAAGSGLRLGSDIPKQYIELHGRSILRHTLDVFTSMENVKDICVVISPEHEEFFQRAIYGLDNITFCIGGDTRKNSVYNGLNSFTNLNSEDIILIHDAARPFVQKSEILALLDEMQRYKAASLACPVVDTLRYDGGEAVSRDNLWAIQTPQAFHYGVLKQAHEECSGENYTDDTKMVSELGIPVKFVKAGKQNFKITYSEDLELAERMLSTQLSTEVRTGLGYDVHAFDDLEGVSTIRLCGVDIAYNRSLKGHSDADVGLHALTDAILGAIGEGDIGLHFPPSNMDFKNMDSAIFLEHAMKLLHDKGGRLINADITLICERPKIGIYREEILKRVAEILNVSTQRVNIKATTTEKLGFIGREEGIAAQASVSVTLPPSLEEKNT